MNQSKVKNVVSSKVQPFPLTSVRLGDGIFKERQDVDAQFLMSIDADRLLVPFRKEAGLSNKAEPYTGWEISGLAGHSLGHYLSALSYLYAATGDAKVKARVEYIVDQLEECQKADGALLPVPRKIYDDIQARKISASGFDLNGVWVPNYNLHKTFAGLRDAYRQVGIDKALELECRLGTWLADIFAPLSDEDIQNVLRAEHGGLNEVLADLTSDTGDHRFLQAAIRAFNHKAVLDPLMQGQDNLNGLHGNTQIPKVIGLARQYELTGEDKYHRGVETFWNAVVDHRSYAMGGHGESEHFFPLSDYPKHLTPFCAETCNTYNMLKLTKHVFAWNPRASQMDFVERALVNHLLANIGQKPGEFGYFLSLAAPAVKVFSIAQEAWWCCVGTGMENPPRYGEQIYAHDDHALWVNLFIASTVHWEQKSITLLQQSSFPDGDSSKMTIQCSQPTQFTLKIRHPYWCARPVLKINGQLQDVTSSPSSYIEIRRTWNDGDVVELHLPMTLWLSSLPHSDDAIVALMYGPMMLVGLMTPISATNDPAKKRFGNHLEARGKTDGFRR